MNDFDEKDKNTTTNRNDYHMKGLSKFGRCLLTGFIIWCAFNYPMSDTMQGWFFAWAVFTWITC